MSLKKTHLRWTAVNRVNSVFNETLNRFWTSRKSIRFIFRWLAVYGGMDWSTWKMERILNHEPATFCRSFLFFLNFPFFFFFFLWKRIDFLPFGAIGNELTGGGPSRWKAVVAVVAPEVGSGSVTVTGFSIGGSSMTRPIGRRPSKSIGPYALISINKRSRDHRFQSLVRDYRIEGKSSFRLQCATARTIVWFFNSWPEGEMQSKQ